MENTDMQKQQLLESLQYIEINRVPTDPIKIDEILKARMNAFRQRRREIGRQGKKIIS